MKKTTLLLVFAILLTTVLVSCSGNYDDGQVNPDANMGDDSTGGNDQNRVNIKRGLKFKGYTYNIYDDEEIEITEYDFDFTEEADDVATADEKEDGVEEIVLIDLEIPAKINDIPVTKIGKGAFEKNRILKSIVVPEGVKEIADEAFWYNYALESVTLPDSLTTLGTRVFNYATSLKSLAIPAGVTVIPDSLCGECTSLESVTFKGKITAIEGGAFAFCTSLTSINLGDSLVSIGADAFKWCSKITEVSLPDTIATIGNNAFDSCAALTTVTFAGEDASVIAIGEGNDIIIDALGITE